MIANEDIAQAGTILGVWAHPDDEAYLSAGLMALARHHGQRVVVVTATEGEQGTDDPRRWPPASLARLRRQELASSLAAVDVHEHHWLGYPDGGCAEVATDMAVDAIGRIIDAVRPDTIVTFGPEGMTGHPDHRVVSTWVTAAHHAHRPSARLWQATLLTAFHEEWGELNRDVGIFPDDASPPATSELDAAAVVRCDGWLRRRKQDALQAHASQVVGLIERVGGDTFERWWSVEAFVSPVATAHAVARAWPSAAVAGSRP